LHHCHQATGLGVAGSLIALGGSEWGQWQRGADHSHSSGRPEGTDHGSRRDVWCGSMPMIGPGGAGWNDEKIADVLTYVRQEWGNKAPAVTTEKVAEIRGKIGTRAEWTRTSCSRSLIAAPSSFQPARHLAGLFYGWSYARVSWPAPDSFGRNRARLRRGE